MYNDFKERKKVYTFTNNINNNNNNTKVIKNNNKMCASGILPSWCNDLHHKFTSTSNIPRYFRLICIFTATSAFILGIVIGLMIPIYFLPNTNNNNSNQRVIVNNNVSTSSLSQIQVPFVEPIQPASSIIDNFDTVSFVPSIQRPSSVYILSSSILTQTEYKKELINSSLIQNGIYWSDKIENMIPYGYDSNSASDWRKFVRKTKVIKIEEGCGRMQNRLLTFDNGSLSCCRYRQNIDQIQGEIFSFYLGRYILNLPNLTPATLSRVKPSTRQWSSVKSQLSIAQWASEDRAVVMTKFIPNLGPSYIPTFLRSSERRLHPPDLNNSTDELNLIELAQWSDLIIFDYLTANLDRVVNNLYNLQWNPTMMQAPAHNLAQDTTSGLLLFLDNESGLLHGYRLLEKYEHFHRAMLDALCIFRKSTANIIKKLHEKNNIGELLRTSFKNSDPEFIDILPMLPEKSVKILNKRIARVNEQISKCESLYQSS